jgi:cytochrome c oxidase assembly factor CtaG
MTPGLIKMWFSLSAIGLMFISVITILVSRSKLKGVLRIIFTILAYLCMIIAGIIMFFVVFTGPISE